VLQDNQSKLIITSLSGKMEGKLEAMRVSCQRGFQLLKGMLQFIELCVRTDHGS